MLPASVRLLRLLTLLQARRHWSGADLTERLGITARTLRRDVERLRTLGYPIRSAAGAAGGYQMGAGADVPPLLLDDDEALAVSVGLRAAVLGSVSGIDEAALRALAKLERVLPARLQRRLAGLHAAIVPLGAPGRPTVDPAVLTAVASACRDGERLRFEYRDRQGRATERDVEPNAVVHAGLNWYLVAWDLGREAWRSFRLDRVGPRITPGPRVARRPPPDGGVAAYVSRSVSLGPYAVKARFRLHAPLATMAERVRPTMGVLEAMDEKSCVLATGAHSPDSLALHIAMLGVDFEVLDPPELADHVRALADRLRRAVGVKAARAPMVHA